MDKKLIRITTIPESLLILLKGQLKFMSSYYEVIAVSSDSPAISKLKDQEGVRTTVVNMTRKITPLTDLKGIYQLYLFLRKEKPFIVHTHTPKAGLLGMIAARLAGVPIRLHTVAGLPLVESTGIKRRILIMVEKITYACAIQIYPNSFEQAKYIINNRFTREGKIKVIGNGSSNGIDTAFFNPASYNDGTRITFRQSCHIREEDTVFCFIGRIVKDKGICELVSQFIILAQAHNNVKLLLIGPFEKDLDPLDDFTEKQILHNPNITWFDFQPDVRPYLAIADIFVFPSYREGFPNVVMQAGSMGLPCIVTDINGCNEIIENGKNGFIIKPKNSGELKEAMSQLLTDKELRSNMAKVSREMIVTRFEREHLWAELLKEYLSFN